jgi:hypothetical protein
MVFPRESIHGRNAGNLYGIDASMQEFIRGSISFYKKLANDNFWYILETHAF